MKWDEPTTIPGLRDSGQINLRLRSPRNYRTDNLRAARGIIVGVILSAAAIILVAWARVLWLMP